MERVNSNGAVQTWRHQCVEADLPLSDDIRSCSLWRAGGAGEKIRLQFLSMGSGDDQVWNGRAEGRCSLTDSGLGLQAAQVLCLL